jgi:1,4-dihydroxy-2-naphthoyl-CoA hydrolase
MRSVFETSSPRADAGRSDRANFPGAMSSLDLSAISDLIPFAAVVGIELLDAGPELVRGRIAWKPERCTAGGVLHGGAIMALADNCGGVCAFLNLPEGARGTATVESKTNFLRAVRDGAITATTRPLHKGRTLIVLETTVEREDGKLAAKVTQTQAYHYPR